MNFSSFIIRFSRRSISTAFLCVCVCVCVLEVISNYVGI